MKVNEPHDPAREMEVYEQVNVIKYLIKCINYYIKYV